MVGKLRALRKGAQRAGWFIFYAQGATVRRRVAATLKSVAVQHSPQNVFNVVSVLFSSLKGHLSDHPVSPLASHPSLKTSAPDEKSG